MTVADTNGRCTLFIGTVSGALIAIAFAGQASGMGTAFFVFSLVLFPSLFFMGLFTFERVLQAGIEDLIYARGITRIRQFYLEHAPQIQPYFVISTHDANGQPSWWQGFLTASGMIAFINSMLVGVFAGLLLAVFTLPLLVCTSAGVVTFLVSFGILQRYQWMHWRRLEQKLTVLFPGQSLSEKLEA